MFEQYKQNKTTIGELFKNYAEKNLNKLPPKVSGIYIVEAPQDFKVEFTLDTVAPKNHPKTGACLLYCIDDLAAKFNKGDKKILYIGETEAKDGLYGRWETRWKFANGDQKARARGGRALWQIKNSGELIFYYYETANAEELEGKLLEEYKAKFGVFPVANMTKGQGCKILKC